MKKRWETATEQKTGKKKKKSQVNKEYYSRYQGYSENKMGIWEWA